MRLLRAELLAVLIATQALAQPAPEECIVGKGQRAVASAEYDGKRYAFRVEGCKEVFESDPERYSQLYDALAELAAEGTKLEARGASLVPS